jgi:hypothetical protein
MAASRSAASAASRSAWALASASSAARRSASACLAASRSRTRKRPPRGTAADVFSTRRDRPRRVFRALSPHAVSGRSLRRRLAAESASEAGATPARRGRPRKGE